MNDVIDFDVADWMRDPELRCCSLAARGLWMDLICVIHQCDQKGHLQHRSGEPFTTAQIARIAGTSEAECEELVQELEACGVFSRNDAGTIYCRRMARGDSPKPKSTKGKCPSKDASSSAEEEPAQETADKSSSVDDDQHTTSIGTSTTRKRKTKSYPIEFENWWILYPRRAAKHDALKAWEKAIARIRQHNDWDSDKARQWLNDKTAEFAMTPTGQGEFCPYPATWLNQGRYDDDPSEWNDRARSKQGHMDFSGIEGFLRESDEPY